MIDSKKSSSADRVNDNTLSVRYVISVLSFVIGMIVGAALSIGAVLIAESIALSRQPGFPEVTYGQYFVLVLTPISGLIGGSLALLFASHFLGFRDFGTSVGILVGAGSFLVLVLLLVADVSQYGMNSSQLVMFPPIVLGAAVLLATSVGFKIARAE